MTEIKQPIKPSPLVIKHWEYKFERAIKILTNGVYTPDELIEKLKEITKSLNQSK